MFTVTTERPEDRAAVETLLNRAFGPDRTKKISYRYRDGVAPDIFLKLVARADVDGRIVGTIRHWPIRAGDSPALLLGPLAVEPELKGRGIGAALMFRALDMAAWAGHRLVLLVGDLDYYARFGFKPASPLGFVMPDEQPHRLLVNELARGAARGGVIGKWTARRLQAA